MAELLKDQFYLLSFYEKLGQALESQILDLKKDEFLKAVKAQNLVDKDLKTKMYDTARVMHQFLPNSFENQLSIVKSLAKSFRGLEGMFLPAWVEIYGLDSPIESVQALKQLTKFSTSEFSIRPFIESNQADTMAEMLKWAINKNEHVRRLASEGCRPRLPWAMALKKLKKDPSDILRILELLKTDESLYVRKSVANNINDITKDNPDIAIALVEGWGYGNHVHTDWIIKHGLRSLIKAGNPRALNLLGFEKVKIKVNQFKLDRNRVKMGDNLDMFLEIKNQGKPANLMLDYVVHFARDKGKMGKKVFKWKSLFLEANEEIKLSKSHSFKKINTRKYYAGEHKVEVQINGEIVNLKTFNLDFD
jgi:3-methyladenine DNA glycosylase AlkC